MLDTVLRWLVDAALRRPWTVVVATVLPTLVAAALVVRVPLDLSFTGIVPKEHAEVAKYLELSEQLNVGGRLLLLLEGPEAELEAAVDAAEALGELEGIQEVLLRGPEDWVEEHAPYLVDDQLFDAWLALADPSRWEEVRDLEDLLETKREELEPPEGMRLVQIQMTHRPLDMPLGASPIPRIEAELEAIYGDGPVAASLTGVPAVAAQDQVRTLSRARLLTPVSLVLVLLVLRTAEPRWRHMLAMAVPMILSMAATLGLVGTITGTLTALETFFGIMVFGLGVDFGLHLTTRMAEEQADGASFEDALSTTFRGTGRGVVAGAATTSGAFFIVAAAPDPMTLHLGLSGGIGLALCLGLMLTLLPALWVLLERGDAPPPRDPRLPWLTRVAEGAAARPVRTLVLGAVLVAVAATGGVHYRFETNLEKVFNREVPALDAGRRVQAAFEINPGPWVLPVDDLDEARRVEAALADEPLFIGTWSAASVLRADREQRAEQLRAALPEMMEAYATLQNLSLFGPPGEREGVRQAMEALVSLSTAARAGPPGIDDLPPSFADQLRLPDGRPVVYAYPANASLDGLITQRERLAVQALVPEATGFGAMIEAMVLAERPWLKWVFAAILGFVVVVLVVDLRKPRWMALAVLPVLCGTVAGFGILCVVTDGFNVMTLLTVPLILGLGVDDGIHVVHRLKEEPEKGPGAATAGVGRAIFLTTLTTCTSFATLMFTDHAGMEGMTLVLLVGLPICLAASVTVIPAAAVLTARR